MSLYTVMPHELVFDGWDHAPGPFLDITVRGVTMRVRPVAPGIGTIERLLSAPLDCYLKPEFAPGQTVSYTDDPGPSPSYDTGFEASPYLP